MRIARFFVLLILGAAAAQRVRFQEVSHKVGLRGRGWMDNWRPELNRYWGTCIFDMNQDGYYDMLLPNHQDNTELYVGGPDGFKFKDTRTPRNDIHGVAAHDWNHDGTEDLLLSRGGMRGTQPAFPRMFEVDPNDERIKEVGPMTRGIDEPVRGRSLAFFDMNADGSRELLMVNRHKEGRVNAHIIYETMKDGTFKKRTDFGFQKTVAAWFCLIDVDRNGFLDVLLMGYGFMELWMGTGGLDFENETWRLNGYENLNGARGCAEVDVDNDGALEIYLVRGGNDGDVNSEYDDMLFRIQDGKFVDISTRWNVPKGGIHSHVTNLDFDNDGYMDLYISVMTWYETPRRRDVLLRNTGHYFQQVPLGETGLHLPYVAWEDGDNAVGFDYNNDGFADLLVGSRNGPWRLYENTLPHHPGKNNWVRIAVGRPRLGSFRKSWDKDPWGALVRVYCLKGRNWTQRTGSPGMSHTASNMLRLTFGIGFCKTVKSIHVYYIGGVRTYRWGGRVNQEIQTGLINCPGKHCVKPPKCVTTRCPTGMCERHERGGSKFYCPL